MKRKVSWDSKSYVRCGHRYCTDCRTKRGNNRGIRKARRAAKNALRKEQ